VVVVGVEAEADVELLRAIDVGDGDRDELELPVHCCLLSCRVVVGTILPSL